MVASARSEWASHVALRGWREAGLNVPCKVRLKLFALDENLVVRRPGTLSESDGRAVDEALGRDLACG